MTSRRRSRRRRSPRLLGRSPGPSVTMTSTVKTQVDPRHQRRRRHRGLGPRAEERGRGHRRPSRPRRPVGGLHLQRIGRQRLGLRRRPEPGPGLRRQSPEAQADAGLLPVVRRREGPPGLRVFRGQSAPAPQSEDRGLPELRHDQPDLRREIDRLRRAHDGLPQRPGDHPARSSSPISCRSRSRPARPTARSSGRRTSIVGLDVYVREAKRTDVGFGDSDHTSFHEAKIPWVWPFTAVTENLHQTSDSVDKASGELMEKVSKLMFVIAWMIAEK